MRRKSFINLNSICNFFFLLEWIEEAHIPWQFSITTFFDSIKLIRKMLRSDCTVTAPYATLTLYTVQSMYHATLTLYTVQSLHHFYCSSITPPSVNIHLIAGWSLRLSLIYQVRQDFTDVFPAFSWIQQWGEGEEDDYWYTCDTLMVVTICYALTHFVIIKLYAWILLRTLNYFASQHAMNLVRHMHDNCMWTTTMNWYVFVDVFLNLCEIEQTLNL